MCSGPHAPPYCPLQWYGQWVHCDCVEDHFRWHAICLKYQIVLQIKYSDRNNANYKELLVSATSSSKYILYAAAAAKSLQSCPTLCDPIDSSPLGSSVPGILQARILEWVAMSFSNAWKWQVKVKSLSRARLLATPWTAAYQTPLSTGFSRQEYWSGMPLPSLTLCIVRNLIFPASHWGWCYHYPHFMDGETEIQ